MNKEIRIDIKSAIIIFLATCVIMFGITLNTSLKNYHGNQAWIQKEIKTNSLLSQITFPTNIAQAFVQLGWSNIQLPQSQLPVKSEVQDVEEK